MEYKSKTKILIAGPTGTGTTFLLGLLHQLGFDTGFSDDVVTNVITGRGKGLEYIRGNPTRKPWLAAKEEGKDISPLVIKHPIQDYGDDGGTGVIGDVLDVVDENGWGVKHLFVTVRNLTSVVESVERRMKVGDMVMFKVRGDEAKRQRELLSAEGFYNMACKLATREHPYTLIEFPKSVDDPEYCYNRLKPLLFPRKGECRVDIESFKTVHAEVAQKDMVHIR